jgi:hypothetical protein
VLKRSNVKADIPESDKSCAVHAALEWLKPISACENHQEVRVWSSAQVCCRAHLASLKEAAHNVSLFSLWEVAEGWDEEIRQVAAKLAVGPRPCFSKLVRHAPATLGNAPL